ncbi:MAG: c-type cytochrome [Gammaproteobacteria bacterium]|nr:c-type cytochrome [Gammaproteobacteria bacterium]
MMMYKNNISSAFILGAILSMYCISSVFAADVQDLVKTCADCHGKDGASTDPNVPIIGGFSAPYAIDSMIAYKAKERPCPESEYLSGDKKGQKTTMCDIAKELDEDEIKKIGKYFASKPFVRAKQDADPVLAAKGKEIHDDLCIKCHAEGASLASDDSGILAGQWMPYVRQAFKEYSAGDRPMVKKMKPKYKKLDAEKIEALIHYFGSFK